MNSEIVKENVNDMMDILQNSHVDLVKSKLRWKIFTDLYLIKSMCGNTNVLIIAATIMQNTSLNVKTFKRLKEKTEKQKLLLHWKIIIDELKKGLKENTDPESNNNQNVSSQ